MNIGIRIFFFSFHNVFLYCPYWDLWNLFIYRYENYQYVSWCLNMCNQCWLIDASLRYVLGKMQSVQDAAQLQKWNSNRVILPVPLIPPWWGLKHKRHHFFFIFTTSKLIEMENIHAHTTRLPTDWGCRLFREVRDLLQREICCHEAVGESL